MLATGRALTRHWPGRLMRPAAPWRAINLVLLATVAAAGTTGYFVAGRESTAQARVSTATVQRGSVLSTVSASGNVQPARTLSLNFSGSGKLTAVYVKEGQHVRAGQPVAKLDDTSQAADVRTARASLASAQANLASLQQPLTPATAKQNEVAVEQAKAAITSQQTALRDTTTGARHEQQTLERAVSQAQAALQQTQKIAAANRASLRNAVGEAKGAWLEATAAAGRDLANLQTAIEQAKAQLQRDQEQLQRDQAQLVSDQNELATYAGQVANANSTVGSLQAQVDADKDRVADLKEKEHSDKCDQTPAPQPKCANDAFKTSQAQSQLSNNQEKLADAQSTLNTAQSRADAAQTAVKSGQTAILNDQTKIATNQEAITTAENAFAAGQLKDAQSVNQAYRSYVNAKDAQKSGLETNKQSIQNAQKSLKDAIGNRDAGKIQNQQSIHNAQASLKTAKQTLESTLASNAGKAEPPTAGELASAAAQIATARAALENALSAQKQMTLVAPTGGTVASITAGVGESPGGAASSSSSSSTAFITLVDLEGPEVVANFSETDAAKIKLGQAATITVDALPNKQLAAHVVSVDTTQTVVSNVVTYGVTFVLDRTTPELKPGMTVSAAVIVAKSDGVLHLPNAAVRTVGGASTVSVIDEDGEQQQRTVTAGVVGDDATEIVNGLKEGEEVVVSAAAAQLTSTTGRTGGAGLRGGGVFFGAG